MSKPFIEGGKEDLGFSIQIVVCYVLTGLWTKIRCMEYQKLQEHLIRPQHRFEKDELQLTCLRRRPPMMR